MEPHQSKLPPSAPSTAFSPPMTTKPTISQQILRSLRGKTAFSSAVATPIAGVSSAPVTPSVTTSALPIPTNPFDYQPLSAGDGPSSGLTSAVEAVEASDCETHLLELNKPLPVASKARQDAIKDRIPRLRALIAAVQLQSSPTFVSSKDLPLAHAFRLCTTLLTAEQPQAIRIQACDLLTVSVKLADQKASVASRVMSESTSGISGSLSFKSPDSDQPLTSIDRALFYRLVLTLSAADIDDPHADPNHAVLAGLSSQLRALQVLTKEGREIVGFPDLVLSLTHWLALAWKEVQTLRTDGRKIQNATQVANTVDDQHKALLDLTAKLSAVEWDVQATLHLLTSILKYSFSRIPLVHAEMALHSAAAMVLGQQSVSRSVRQTVASPSMRATPLIGPYRSRTRGASAAAIRSKSRDTRPLLEGYSYYGLETITPSGSEENSPAMTPKLGPKALSPELGLTNVSLYSSTPAPITLATIAPGREAAVPVSQGTDAAESIYFFGPELDIADVRSTLKLLDATLRYGYLPPTSVNVVTRMLCRLLGYPLVDPHVPGFIPRTVNLQESQVWRNDVWPIFANVLRSHCANASIRAVRELLTEQDDVLHAKPLEDPAVLVGAVSFFRSALAHTFELEAEKLQHSSMGTTAKQHAEDALTPSLPLSLVAPALRATLKRQCDLLDLEVLNLVADFFPSHQAEHESRPRISSSELSQADWDLLLDLAADAKRHVEGWRFKGTGFASLATARQLGGAESASYHRTLSSVDEPTAPILAMVNLLSRLHLAPPSKPVEHRDEEGELKKTAKASASASLLPWTSKLASFLLSFAPLLPDATVVDLIQYFRSQHLCLPSHPDWISNIRSLLQAFYHRHDLDDSEANSKAFARHKLASLLFEHIYNAIQDMDRERNTLMVEIILPLANSTLFTESDPLIEEPLRRMLVHSAALSGSQIPGPIDPEAEQEQPQDSADDVGDFEEVFLEVRKLLCRLTRINPVSHASLFEKGFKSPTMESATRVANATEDTTLPLSTSKDHQSYVELKASHAVLDLIAIFNRMAFSTPWIASSVDRKLGVAVRRKWEKKTRAGCIAIFRELLELLRPNKKHADGSFEPLSRTESSQSNPPVAVPTNASTPCSLIKLLILEWFVRIRTDRQHRVYLAGDLDELVASSANILLKGPVEAEDHYWIGQTDRLADVSAGEGDRQRATRSQNLVRSERDSRDIQRTADTSNRSKSRVREMSRDRGRQERTSDSPRRGFGERNRSISQSRRVPVSKHKSLWRLPQKVRFEMPSLNLRSDIIYTYIHQRNDKQCCSGQVHTFSEEEGLPVPLPISEFLAVATDIIQNEQDWEIVSYLICHLPHQLSNKHLFCGPKAQIKVINLRRVLCEGVLKDALCPHVILPEEIKKTDVYAVAYSTLTVLVSYRTLFSRSEQDDMVEAFILGLNKSQNTAQPCVRALSVACYELQKSFTRFISKMLVKLSTVMSSMTMSVHILELIVTVAHIPSCYANFTEADFKRVFGIALQYIQYHQSTAAATRDDWRANPASFSLSQYVMMMAYYNIALWFITLKITDRPKHVSYICRGLLVANEGMEKLSDQTEVCFDFLARCTHSNADHKPKRSFINSLIMGPSGAGSNNKAKDPNRQSKTWIMGKGLLTITSLKKEGWVELLIRRPSGTAAMLCKLENVPISPLPDENGERMDLLAILMMNRKPEIASAPVLLAPLLDAKSFSASVDRPKSFKEQVEQRLQLGEQLRSRRLLGPAHFGLTRKPRAASFSGAISHSTVAFQQEPDVDAYRHPPESRGDDEVKGVQVTRSPQQDSEAMRKIMREILSDEGMDSNQNDNPKPTQPATVSKAVSTLVDPGFIGLQLSSYPDMTKDKAPILLPDEPATDRMIRAVDLTPVVDFHKIGVLYVGPGQENEVDVLGNRHGSPSYMRFLAGLGDLITLKDQEDVYTGGLDRNSDEHGKYAYVWTDDISQIVFHTATLMPNKPEDRNHSFKKALIGNDWVHIVFNESGREYKFGTIPSQFNYVNVCISPDSKGGANSDDAVFYRVSLQKRPGLPDFSPIGDGQLVSAETLPAFVKNIALNSNLMSQIYLDTGEAMQPYTSNWVSRLHHIQRYRTQLETKRKAANPDGDMSSGPTGYTDPAEIYDFSRLF